MNKTKIEWVKGPNGESGYTWNPVTGCLHGCEYCYAMRQANRFKGWTDSEGETHYDLILKPETQLRELSEPLHIAPKERLGKWPKAPYPFGFRPTFHRYRLNEPQKLKKPAKIFVVSMGDLFGDWVPAEWIREIYQACQKADWNTYLFLTKNPRRYSEIYRSDLDYRHYMWFGTTITNNNDMDCRAYELFCTTGFDSKHAANRFLSMEPLLEEIDMALLQNIKYFKWVIIGAQTGPGAKPPKPEWVQSIIDQCGAAGVPVFLKDNLKWPVKIQEWPE